MIGWIGSMGSSDFLDILLEDSPFWIFDDWIEWRDTLETLQGFPCIILNFQDGCRILSWRRLHREDPSEFAVICLSFVLVFVFSGDSLGEVNALDVPF